MLFSVSLILFIFSAMMLITTVNCIAMYGLLPIWFRGEIPETAFPGNFGEAAFGREGPGVVGAGVREEKSDEVSAGAREDGPGVVGAGLTGEEAVGNRAGLGREGPETVGVQPAAQSIEAEEKSPTLDCYFREWQDSRRGTIAPSTAYNNEKRYEVIGRCLGQKPLHELTSAVIAAFQQELLTMPILRKGEDTGRHYAVRTIREEMALLSSILKSAAEAGLISRNPCTAVKPVRDDSARSIRDGAHRALTDVELNRFFTEAKSSWYYPLFVFLMHTGCRAGEAAALKWEDIDLPGRLVFIHRTLEQTGPGVWKIAESPKTASGVRRIHLSEEAVRALSRQYGQIQAVKKACPDTEPVRANLIFISRNGGYVNRNNINTAIKSVLRRIRRDGTPMAAFSSHAFRHSFATKCVEQGMQPEILKGILGHSDISMTMGTYYHLSQERMDQALAGIRLAA